MNYQVEISKDRGSRTTGQGPQTQRGKSGEVCFDFGAVDTYCSY